MSAAHDHTSAVAATARSPYPFAWDVDPAHALNRRAKERNWAVACDTSLSFVRPELAAMLEVWREHCRPNRLPSRSEFTHRDLKPFLRELCILGITGSRSPRRYMHRFVGSSLVERLGEITGVFLHDYLPPPIHEKIAFFLDGAVDGRCPLRTVIEFELPAVSHMRAEAFLMPLAADGERPDTVFSLTYFAPKQSS